MTKLGVIAIAAIVAVLAILTVYFVFFYDKEDKVSGGNIDSDSSNDDILAAVNQLQSSLQSNTNALQSQINGLDSDIDSLDTSTASLQTQVDGLDSEIGSLNLFTTSIDTKATSAQSDATQALADASSASSAATSAQSDATQAQTDATQALADAATANTTINGIIGEIDVKLTCSTGTADSCFSLGVEEFKFDNNQPAAMVLDGAANYQGNIVELKANVPNSRGGVGVDIGKPCGDNWELRYIVRHTGTTGSGADAFGAFANSDEIYDASSRYDGAIQTEVDIFNNGSYTDRLNWYKNNRQFQFSSANFTQDTGSSNRFEYRLRRSGDTYTWEVRGLDTSFEFSDTRTITGMQTSGNFIGVYAFSGGQATKFDLDYLEFRTFPSGTNIRSWLS